MWIILALNDVDKPYIHSTYESIIDALQMHYKLEDNNIKNQMVEMEIYNDYWRRKRNDFWNVGWTWGDARENKRDSSQKKERTNHS